MELSSDEKCAIERDRVVKIMKEAGEAKSKLFGFGSEASVSSILESLDLFYSEEGAATGGEILTRAYAIKQSEREDPLRPDLTTNSGKPRKREQNYFLTTLR